MALLIYFLSAAAVAILAISFILSCFYSFSAFVINGEVGDVGESEPLGDIPSNLFISGSSSL